MARPSFPAAALSAAKSCPSARRGSRNTRLSKKCPAAAIERFPKSIRSGDAPHVSSVCRLQPAGPRRSAHRLHRAQGARQGRGAQPHQTPPARGRPAGTGIIESRVVNRIQSPAQSTALPVHRTSGRGSPSVYQVRKFLVLLLAGYKSLISPLLPSACRFYPTCSQYMREAIEVHGPARGIWLGLKRLGRCHPFHEGGVDPVPTETQ